MLNRLSGTALAVALSLVAVEGNAADVTVRFPVEYSLETTPGRALSELKALIEERSDGRIAVELYPSGSLYRGLDVVQAILRGDAEMSALIQTYWSALSPQTALFELPYVFPTKQSFYDAVDGGLFNDAYAEVADKGAQIIGVLPYDYLTPGSRATPLIEPDDFAGLKFRGLGRVNLATLEHWGAAPVSINFVEISPAIQQGTIDALNVPTDNYLIYKWTESIRNITYATYYICFYPMMVNKAWWEGLDPELRDIIQEATTEIAAKYRPIAEAASDQALADMRADGVAVHVQTPEEQAAWMETVTPIWDQFRDQVGEELISAVEQYRN